MFYDDPDQSFYDRIADIDAMYPFTTKGDRVAAALSCFPYSYGSDDWLEAYAEFLASAEAVRS
jgi:hypothetical protein